MDTIRFSRRPLASPADDLYRVQVDIRTRPLLELVRAAELPLATADGQPELAGRYEQAIIFGWRDDPPPAMHYLGATGSDRACGAAEKTLLLGCICGEEGCWPLLARIEVGPRRVTWSAFEQPYRPHWDYGLKLVFDRWAYEDALAALGPVRR